MEPTGIQLFPVAASSIAGHVDALYAFLVAVSAFFSLIIAFLVILFAVKYRHRPRPNCHPFCTTRKANTAMPAA